MFRHVTSWRRWRYPWIVLLNTASHLISYGAKRYHSWLLDSHQFCLCLYRPKLLWHRTNVHRCECQRLRNVLKLLTRLIGSSSLHRSHRTQVQAGWTASLDQYRWGELSAKARPSQQALIVIQWAFNDPGPTQNTFSTLAGSSSAQSAFFSSLTSFLMTNNFDGVDLDWYLFSVCLLLKYC